MSHTLLSQPDLRDLLRLPPRLRFAHIMALNARSNYANRLNVVELMAWLADEERELAEQVGRLADSSLRIPASSDEVA
jgi:hypothetical protein